MTDLAVDMATLIAAVAAGGLTALWVNRTRRHAEVIERLANLPETEEDRKRRADIAALDKCLCPDCGEDGLLAGPSGGMSQNVLCNSCLMEFNVHYSFNGVLAVDRTGKASMDRAKVFGVDG